MPPSFDVRSYNFATDGTGISFRFIRFSNLTTHRNESNRNKQTDSICFLFFFSTAIAKRKKNKTNICKQRRKKNKRKTTRCGCDQLVLVHAHTHTHTRRVVFHMISPSHYDQHYASFVIACLRLKRSQLVWEATAMRWVGMENFHESIERHSCRIFVAVQSSGH